MPFTLLRRKRPTISAPNDGCSSSTATNDGAAHIKSNKTSKRKKRCTQSTVNSKATREYDESNNRQQQLDTVPEEGYSEPPSISSILLELFEKGKVRKLADYVRVNNNKYKSILQLLKEQEECVDGCGQDLNREVDLAASDALYQHYSRLGDDRGLVELQDDRATCFEVSKDK